MMIKVHERSGIADHFKDDARIKIAHDVADFASLRAALPKGFCGQTMALPFAVEEAERLPIVESLMSSRFYNAHRFACSGYSDLAFRVYSERYKWDSLHPAVVDGVRLLRDVFDQVAPVADRRFSIRVNSNHHRDPQSHSVVVGIVDLFGATTRGYTGETQPDAQTPSYAFPTRSVTVFKGLWHDVEYFDRWRVPKKSARINIIAFDH